MFSRLIFLFILTSLIVTTLFGDFVSFADSGKLTLPFAKDVIINHIQTNKNSIELKLTEGTKILSPENGKISLACYNQNSSTIKHINDKGQISFFYPINLESFFLKLNEETLIRKGDVIGKYNSKYPINEKCEPSLNPNLFVVYRKNECPFQFEGFALECDSKNNPTFTNLDEIKFETDCNELIKQNYSIGESGNKVTTLQKCLTDLGKYKFQFGPTGYFGQYTKSIMTQEPDSKPLPKNNCTSYLADKYYEGEKSQRVLNLQICLMNKKYFNYEGGATGFYGNVTKLAYIIFLNSDSEVCEILKKATFYYGENSYRVKRLQQCLKEAKLLNHPTNTGFFGSKTLLAFNNWI
ncbi:MAG: hypothetical protein ACRCXZ_02055 [Patescibacteria group bacterium]